MVIGDYLGRRAIYSPARLAIVYAGKTPALRLTYAELNVRANNVAHWLRSVAGVRKGDRVGVLARDGVEHLDILTEFDIFTDIREWMDSATFSYFCTRPDDNELIDFRRVVDVGGRVMGC